MLRSIRKTPTSRDALHRHLNLNVLGAGKVLDSHEVVLRKMTKLVKHASGCFVALKRRLGVPIHSLCMQNTRSEHRPISITRARREGEKLFTILIEPIGILLSEIGGVVPGTTKVFT
jgi:hypothetical protein